MITEAGDYIGDHTVGHIVGMGYATPVGTLSIIFDPKSEQLLAAGFCEVDELQTRLAADIRSAVSTNSAQPVAFSKSVAAAVDEYFAGDLTAFDSFEVRQSGTDLQAEVWESLRNVPPGETWTYSQLAAKTSKPGAVRAVASACGKNLVAPIVPCHRIVRSDGSLGGYLYGLDIKRWLLDHESKPMNRNHESNHSWTMS